MAGSYYGKDGYFYSTLEEKRRADKNWEQQENQNKLLQEQNRLLEEEQQKKQREEHDKAIKEAASTEYDSDKLFLILNIFPRLEEAGINNPEEYYSKLEMLYGMEPKCLTKLDKDNIDTYNNDSLEGLKNENDLFDNKPRYEQKEKILNEIRNVKYITPTLIQKILKIDEKSKRMEMLNQQIEEYNNSLKEEQKEWENKIKKFELKRIANFNYILEFILEDFNKLAYANLIYRKYGPPHGISLCQYDYKLRFNPYPADYKEKKEEYMKKLKNEDAEDTEYFSDLYE